jgi:hypothetical protein
VSHASTSFLIIAQRAQCGKADCLPVGLLEGMGDIPALQLAMGLWRRWKISVKRAGPYAKGPRIMEIKEDSRHANEKKTSCRNMSQFISMILDHRYYAPFFSLSFFLSFFFLPEVEASLATGGTASKIFGAEEKSKASIS